MSRTPPPGRSRTTRRPRRRRRATSVVATLAVAAATVLQAVVATTPASAVPAPVGQGFTVTASDLSFILKQIKIAERHAAHADRRTNPCGDARRHRRRTRSRARSVSKGLRTVDGSCNNLQPGQETFGAADQLFPRIASKSFRDAEERPPASAPPASTSYTQKSGNVFDSEPRIDQQPDRRPDLDQPGCDRGGRVPGAHAGQRRASCRAPRTRTRWPDPPVDGRAGRCVPTGQTLFIPNVTTDVGLSPPYNSLFTLFGQFFDHGVDQTVKSGGTVFVPLKADDPLRHRRPGPQGQHRRRGARRARRSWC